MTTNSIASPDTQLSLLRSIQRRFKIDHDASLAQLVHYGPKGEQPFHHWFRYREAFAPELIDWSIRGSRRPPHLVLDPFCGSGTTLMAATQSGMQAVGFEINPVLALVARAKTRNYTARDRERIRASMALLTHITPRSPTPSKPALTIIDKVFKSDILQALLAGRRIIEQEENLHARDFLLVGWLSVLESVSNVFKEGNGIKYRNRRRTPKGYFTIPWEETEAYRHDAFDFVNSALARKYEAMLADVEGAAICTEPIVHQTSALQLSQYLGSESVSLSIFSPPYCNNFNYMKIFKVELWMGGFINDYGGLRALSNQALRSHVETPIELPAVLNVPEELETMVEWVRRRQLWHRKIPDAILAYFLDMQTVLSELLPVLKNGSQCIVVVGNSAYGGIVIPTDLLLAEIGRRLGYVVERLILTRHLTTSSQQRAQLGGMLEALRETIIVFRKD